MRIIGGITPGEYERHGGQTFEVLRVRSYPSGHQVVSLTKQKTLSEPPAGWSLFGGWEGPPMERKPRGSGDREASQASAVARARSAVRRKCLEGRFDAMWTLTYRDLVVDRDLVESHWRAFRLKVARYIPGFTYVVVLELQARGSLHLHIATHGLPARLEVRGRLVKSWDLMRQFWRSVVGPLGGSFHERKYNKLDPNARMLGPVQLATYISKYIGKDMDQVPFGGRRFWSGGIFTPAEEVITRRKVDEAVSESGFSDTGVIAALEAAGDKPRAHMTRFYFHVTGRKRTEADA